MVMVVREVVGAEAHIGVYPSHSTGISPDLYTRGGTPCAPRSAQSEKSKDEQDDYDKSNNPYNLIHVRPPITMLLDFMNMCVPFLSAS